MENFLSSLRPWLETVYFGNSVREYLIALGILLGFWIFLRFLKNRIFKIFKLVTSRTRTDLDDEIVKVAEIIPGPLYFFASLFLALQIIEVHHIVTKIVETVLIILITYWLIRVATELIEYGLHRVAKKRGEDDKGKTNAYFALSFIAKIGLWTVGFLVILSNLGIDVTALTASLGIGGIAVALAVQNILGDMLSSFSLYMDKPFEVGDYISIGKDSGTVKRIGLKSTRIKALRGEEMIISNNELTSSRVQNFRKLKTRRIEFEIAIVYGTKTKLVEKIPKMLEKIIQKMDLIQFDRAHLARFSEFGLVFEIVYTINSSDYQKYMDIQQEINLNILKAFDKEKIKLAFPAQAFHMKKG